MVEEIRTAKAPTDIDAIRTLFVEYASVLGFSLCFQGFDRELTELPGHYAAPAGSLRLATLDGAPTGCVALRPLESGICEMKRLFVRPDARRTGLGRRLVEVILEDARRIGYQRMRLDTLATMTAAIALYRSVGFRTIAAYYDNPIESAVYLERDLNAESMPAGGS